MRLKVTLVAALALAILATPALAQVTEPTGVVNGRFSFTFIVEPGCLVTYPENGDGFSAIHNPEGGGKGTQADYGLIVYGGFFYRFTEEMAAAAKLDPPEETMLSVEDISNNTRFNELMKAAMSVFERESAGDAVVQVENGSSIKVPYFTWSRTVGTKTHYGLMYSVIHGDAFVTVQAESNRPFTKPQLTWFTTQLELNEIPEPDTDAGV
jgi:hypothetical protein